ncbi:TRAP transporter small permease subunit [Oricola sp.]|uniref:TRAP transporter small permease n=1 Tax=Oricola sp. TaxID=1979950 RepID=UPI0025D30F47|nr:TRAP transporter small permease subunit [Oricola sp.]MCI5078274.1 TRAP transporter small permease subunit [Oricola sp.]
MQRLDGLLSRIEDALHLLGCASLVLIAVLINGDIFGRLLFSTPLQFQFEMVEFYLMPAVATLSLSRVFRDGGHLALEFITPEIFGSFWPAVRIFMLVAAAIFFVAVTIMSGQLAAHALSENLVYFGIVDWPLGWAYLSVPVGCAVLTARLLFETTTTRSVQSATAHH